MACNGYEISRMEYVIHPLSVYRKKVSCCDSILMTDSTTDLTARSLKDAAEAAMEKGDAGYAGSLLDQALEKLKAEGQLSALYAQVAVARADLFWGAQDLEAASELYQQALELFEKEFGTNSEVVGICVRNLGEICGEKGDAMRAKHYKNRWQEIIGRQP